VDRLGELLTAGIGLSQMTAHVHHLQDYVGGHVIGYLGALFVLILLRWVIRPRLSSNLRAPTR
jgi:membrane-associated phospholipid phosphatase